MFCSQCGHDLADSNGNFCPNCGSARGNVPPAKEITSKLQNFHPNKKIVISVLIGVIVVVAFVFFQNRDSFAGNPYGLNGRWEEQYYLRRYGRPIYLEFRGNNIVQMSYREYWTNDQITVADLENGEVSISRMTNWIGASQVHTYEILEQIDMQWDMQWIFVSHFRKNVQGTFSISDDGRIELIWPDGQGIQVLNFSRTENTIEIGDRYFVRVATPTPTPAPAAVALTPTSAPTPTPAPASTPPPPTPTPAPPPASTPMPTPSPTPTPTPVTVAPAPTPSPVTVAPAPTTTPENSAMFITTSNLNLREEASTSSPSLGIIPSGTIVYLIISSACREWYWVLVENVWTTSYEWIESRTGFMAAEFLQHVPVS